MASLSLVVEKESFKVLLHVVCECIDMFPKDFISLPPKRDIEFTIEFTLGTSPILIAPYHLALVELREFKEQLENLSKKVFIRPSTSL